METQVTSWLNEGLRHYSSGDAARALEAWYRILEVEPTHPAALEYVAFVRDAFRDGVAVAATDVPADVVEVAEPAAVAPAPVETATSLAAPRADSVDGFSWADLVGEDMARAVLAPAPAPVLPAPVEVAAPAIVAEVAAAVVGDDDGGVDVEMTDDEPVGLPSIIIADDDDDADAIPSMIVEADVEHVRIVDDVVVDVAADEAPVDIDIDIAADVPLSLVAPPSLLAPPVSEDEVMPAPDAASAARAVPRRLTPLSTPAPPLSFDFETLVRNTPVVEHAPVAAIEIASVVLDPPVLDLPRSPTPLAMTTSIAPSAPLEDRVIRQSIRFDEPRSPARGASSGEGSGPVPMAAVAPTPTPATMSPWDDAEGPAQPLDLDVSSRPASSFDTLLRSASTSTTPAPAPTVDDEPEAVLGEELTPTPADELESLMTGARELFELGDFSGSLELVEKVLRTNDKHEGARAYLKRNEATLLRMYESKIGDMTRVPRPLVPPDEVIWMNMHHRAGFILSQVDGTLSYEDLLEVSGMDRFDTVRIVADLVTAGIIG